MKKIHFDDAICSIFIPPQNDEVYWIYILSLSHILYQTQYIFILILCCAFMSIVVHTHFPDNDIKVLNFSTLILIPLLLFTLTRLSLILQLFSTLFSISVRLSSSICLRMLETFFSAVICVEAVFLSRSRLNFLKKARNDVWKFN